MMKRFEQAEELVFELYQEAKLRPPSEYKQWAMQKSADLIGFDSGVWGDGGNTLEVFSLFLFNQSQEMLENYGRLLAEGMEDDLTAKIIENLGSAVAQEDFIDDWLSHPWYQAHCHKFGMEQACSMAFYRPNIDLFTCIAYYRDDINRPFTDEEKALKELIDPHLREAYEISMLLNMASELRASVAEDEAFALVQSDGTVNYCNDYMVLLLRSGVIDLGKAIFPESFMEKVTTLQPFKYKDTFFTPSKLDSGLIFLSAHKAGRVDLNLTEKEREVAIQLASGYSYKKIGLILGKSPKTIQNQAASIYKKLGVSNKTELASIL
ncbi:MAG: hypothetical protein JXR18_11140 [Neptuniibacter sp.]